MNAECSSKAQLLSSNLISTLPQTIIEHILCLLPIKEAARTSILSREWRYMWTTIPKLVFDWYTMSERTTEEKEPSDIASAMKNMDHSCKLFNAIHQVLLMRQGPIHEFTLCTIRNTYSFELDQTIFHLSKNHTVKKLTLAFNDKHCKLPLSAYSVHQLTGLDLTDVDLNHQPISIGFGSLRSLCFINVGIRTKAPLHPLSNCPSLKSFTLIAEDVGSKDCTFMELFECLPVIEHLTIWRDYVHSWLVLDSIPEELPTSLIHLKYFSFYEMCFADNHGLTFLAVLIKCCPNLEKIELEINTGHSYCYENEICCGKLEEYSDVWLESLKELEIRFFRNLKREMAFVKFILARSPKLKKVSIHSLVEKNEESGMLKVLLQAPRASPVQIVVT